MKKSKLIDEDDLCFVEEVEENGSCDAVLGTQIAQFTFESNSAPSNQLLSTENTLALNVALLFVDPP